MAGLSQATRWPEFFNRFCIGLNVARMAVWNFAAKAILPFVSTDSEPPLQIQARLPLFHRSRVPQTNIAHPQLFSLLGMKRFQRESEALS
jgi:hypothetical protein